MLKREGRFVDWMTIVPLALVGLVVAFVAGFMVLLVLVAYFEKRLVDPIVEVRIDQTTRAMAERDERSVEAVAWKLSPYVERMSDDAQAAGFRFGSIAVHKKVPSVKTSGALWISEDRRILVSTSSGSILNMPASKTLLLSKLSTGEWFITADHFDDADTTGGDHHEYLENADFYTLLDWHRRRIAAEPRVVSLPAGTPFKILSDRYKTIVQRIMNAGDGRYRDANQQYWSHSLRSALRFPARLLAQTARATSGTSGPQRTTAIADVRRTLSTGNLVARWSTQRLGDAP